MERGAFIFDFFENLKFGVRLFLQNLTSWRGGAFIFIELNMMEGGGAFISMKFRSNLP